MKKLLIITFALLLAVTPVLADETECLENEQWNEETEMCELKPVLASVPLMQPRVNGEPIISGGVGGVTFSFLTNQFMSCGLLVSQTPQSFVVTGDGWVTTDGNTVFGNVDGLYGYDRLAAMESINATYHVVGVPLERGTYNIRPFCDYQGKDILGQEAVVTIK